MSTEPKCPVPHGQGQNPSTATETSSPMHGAVTINSRKVIRNEDWWPDRLDLAVLSQNNALVDPSTPPSTTPPSSSPSTSTPSSPTSTPS